MERCKECEPNGLEGECLKLGRCSLTKPEPEPEAEEWVHIRGYEGQHRLSSHGRVQQIRCARGLRVVMRIQTAILFGGVPHFKLSRPHEGDPEKPDTRAIKFSDLWAAHFPGRKVKTRG